MYFGFNKDKKNQSILGARFRHTFLPEGPAFVPDSPLKEFIRQDSAVRTPPAFRMDERNGISVRVFGVSDIHRNGRNLLQCWVKINPTQLYIDVE